MGDNSFAWPTYDEVLDYAAENRLTDRVDVRKFYDYYAKQDFMYRGRPMDWKDRLFYWAQTEKSAPKKMTTASNYKFKHNPKYDSYEYLDYIKRTVDSWGK